LVVVFFPELVYRRLRKEIIMLKILQAITDFLQLARGKRTVVVALVLQLMGVLAFFIPGIRDVLPTPEELGMNYDQILGGLVWFMSFVFMLVSFILKWVDSLRKKPDDPPAE
jgi:hypothetical protein